MKNYSGLSLSITAVIILTLITLPAASTGFTAAYLNIQEVVRVHPAAEGLEVEMQEEILILQQEFESQAAELDPELDAGQLQQLRQNLQQQARLIQITKNQELLKIIQPDFAEFREQYGYDLLLAEEAVISGAHNATEDFIDYLTEKYYE